MAIANLQEQFIHSLAELHDAETRFLEGQRKMMEKASSDKLKSMLKEHMTQTSQQIDNINQLYTMLDSPPPQATNAVAAALVQEAERLMGEAGDNGPLRDVIIASAVSKVEHFEIGCYKPLITAAQQMGNRTFAQKLAQNLQQEEMTAHLIEQSAPLLLQQAQQALEAGG